MKKTEDTGSKGKKVRNQFVLIVGDEGAILSHFHNGRLESRLFAESAASIDIGLMQKLFATYPKSPISILVDVIEQSYSQQVLPPVSRLAVKQQINKRLKRDFAPQDFSNYMSMGRSVEGRKDWNFLFISLASSPPFSDWLSFILNQKNDFGGVYLLPVEAQNMIAEVSRVSGQKTQKDWEIAIFHNKTGGFRIIAFKKGKIIFTRLAQQLVGENVPEVVVGALEQEVLNTIEYLKRLGFRGEENSRIVLIAAQEIIEKVDKKIWAFGELCLYTPAKAAQIFGMGQAVYENDKYADIICSAFFASRKPVLQFDSLATRNITQVYNLIRTSYTAAILMALILVGLSITEVVNVYELFGKQAESEKALRQANIELTNFKKAEKLLPVDYRRRIDIMQISSSLPEQKDVIEEKIMQIGGAIAGYRVSGDSRDVFSVNSIKISVQKNDKNSFKEAGFAMEIGFGLEMLASEQDFVGDRVKNFSTALKNKLKGYEVTFTKVPAAEAAAVNQKVVVDQAPDPNAKVKLPGVVVVKGDLYSLKPEGQKRDEPNRMRRPNNNIPVEGGL